MSRRLALWSVCFRATVVVVLLVQLSIRSYALVKRDFMVRIAASISMNVAAALAVMEFVLNPLAMRL